MPISTPRSPRATMTASDASTIASRFATASAFSIFATIRAGEPAASISAAQLRDVVGRAHEGERDVVDALLRARTRDRPDPSPSAPGSAAATRQVDTLGGLDRPPDLDAARESRPSLRARRVPDRGRRRSGPRRPDRRPRRGVREGDTELAVPACARVGRGRACRRRDLDRMVAARRRGSSGRRGRRATAIGRPTRASAIAHGRARRSRCSSCVPCEKFSRATSMPAAASSKIVSGSLVAGPERADDLRSAPRWAARCGRRDRLPRLGQGEARHRASSLVSQLGRTGSRPGFP